MSEDNLQAMSDLELEFMQEVRGFGSLAPQLFRDGAATANSTKDSGSDDGYVGYDIRPEDLEALYFEGIGIPRWESITADTVARQIEIYEESMQKIMTDYPLINRVTDTDVKVEYKPDEISKLSEECERVLKTTTNPKAVRALQKFLLTCTKASDHQTGLLLIPT